MKSKTDHLLLLGILLTSALSVLAVLIWLELLPDLGIPNGIRSQIALFLSAFPTCFLQLLLCRNAKRGWVKALPLLILLGIVLVIFLEFITSSGWDGLGWLLLLILCIPSALGILLGWLVHWVSKKRK